MNRPFGAADPADIRPIPFAERAHKVSVREFGRVLDSVPDIEKWLTTLPEILAARDLRRIVDRWANATRSNRAVVIMLGGHVVKTGCSPFFIDLIERGWITHVALNGATAIHDFEIACFGETSEDVAESLADGTFGLIDETGRWMAEAVDGASELGIGYGEALGRWLLDHGDLPHVEHSLLAAACRHRVPLTVHAAIGAEIIHQHPAFDGAAVGAASHRDFRVLTHSLRGLHAGGFVANVGSAVVLPEVFVKALNLARHLWPPVHGFTAANLDMLRHYRPLTNVTGRPILEGGEGYDLAGHHEILIPLVYYALRTRLA